MVARGHKKKFPDIVTLKGNTYMHCELAVSGSFGRYFFSFTF
jgi:hypothetical protein